MYPSISKSYKGVYPFRLGTTSFIYPDHYVPNVKMLGPYLDEIELLLFESAPANALPAKSDIAQLLALAQSNNLAYNIHLPIDVCICDPQPEKQQRAVETILNVVELTAPLRPTAYTLHIPYSGEHLDSWQRRVVDSLEKILAGGVQPELIAVETLDDNFYLLDEILEDFHLSVCLDLGHLMVRAVNIQQVFNTYSRKISIIHLHGFNKNGDHKSLDQLSEQCVQSVSRILRRFRETVSLEVFSYKDLMASLDIVDRIVPGNKK
ncbi:MAG: cobamide remodeling phosphodiesterase CbiR [Desulfobacterales bacterium]|nr:cobamide remodeling phosphodiesterase CbiR [Desulfobacterales bacterium]